MNHAQASTLAWLIERARVADTPVQHVVLVGFEVAHETRWAVVLEDGAYLTARLGEPQRPVVGGEG